MARFRCVTSEPTTKELRMTSTIPCSKPLIEQADIDAVVAALSAGELSRGTVVPAFEEAFADLVGAQHAVAVSSSTAGLHLATVVSGGDEKGARWISTPNTFVRTINAVVHGDGVPVLVDINPDTFLVDIAQLVAALERHEGKLLVGGVLPVHFAGMPVNMESLARVTKKSGVRVIEDASYALGAMWEDSRGELHTVGDCAFSDMTIFAFDPNKAITTGEGGMVTTNDAELADRLRLLRDHGVVRDAASLPDAPGPWYFEMRELGFNFRMSDLNAALGMAQLDRLPAFIARRRDLALRYDRLLAGLAGVTPQRQPRYAMSSYTFYVVRIDYEKVGETRLTVVESLKDRGIETSVHYVPLHLHPYFQERYGFTEGLFPMAERYYQEALSLPLHPGMEDSDVDRVVDALSHVLDV